MRADIPAAVAVAGGGLMGCGIAAVCALAGLRVLVYEDSVENASKIAKRCHATFEELKDAGALLPSEATRAAAQISITSKVTDLGGFTFVIEAITESLESKRALYGSLELVLGSSAVIASSTSGFTPQALSQEMQVPQRFIVAHFWNPPHLIPLVEVLAGPDTANPVIESTMRLLRHCQMEPVLLRKAVPGFIGNRLQFAVLREALNLLRQEVADAETIDAVMRNSLGRRYAHFGPLEGADLGGLETFLRISRYLMPQLSKDEDVLSQLETLVASGETGRSSGRGFYHWDARREAHLTHLRHSMIRQRISNRESF